MCDQPSEIATVVQVKWADILPRLNAGHAVPIRTLPAGATFRDIDLDDPVHIKVAYTQPGGTCSVELGTDGS